METIFVPNLCFRINFFLLYNTHLTVLSHLIVSPIEQHMRNTSALLSKRGYIDPTLQCLGH